MMQAMGAPFWGAVASACHFVDQTQTTQTKRQEVHLLFKCYSLSLALFSVQQPGQKKKERDYQIIIL